MCRLCCSPMALYRALLAQMRRQEFLVLILPRPFLRTDKTKLLPLGIRPQAPCDLLQVPQRRLGAVDITVAFHHARTNFPLDDGAVDIFVAIRGVRLRNGVLLDRVDRCRTDEARGMSGSPEGPSVGCSYLLQQTKGRRTRAGSRLIEGAG
jgi:hypothetical protein